MVDFKAKLAQIKQQQASSTVGNSILNRFKKQETPPPPVATTTGLRRPGLNSLSSAGNSGGGLRDKFKKRSQNVLQETYEKREEKSKSSGMGKSIFNRELLDQFGIEEFQPVPGDHFFEVLPISYDPNEPYHKECIVHFGVGINRDSFVCMFRSKGKPCYRCEQQTQFYRQFPHKVQNEQQKEKAKAMFPTDRVIYLTWNRTKELIENAAPDFTFQIWAAPKAKVHSEIQAKAYNKIERITLDISDVSEGGEGRTVAFSIVKQGDWPEYKAFDLMQRTKAIPNEVLEKLDRIINFANEQGYKNAIEAFIHYPEYNEVKESMLTENSDDNANGNTPVADNVAPVAGAKAPLRQSFAKPQQTTQSQNSANQQSESELMQMLESLQNELEKMNPIQFNKWCNENGYAEATTIAKSEAIPAIIDDLYEKELASSGNTF